MAISVERITPGNPVVVPALEGAGQSYVAGDLVQFAAGYVVVASEGIMHGIARKDWSLSGAACEVELIDRDAVYSAKVGTGVTHAQTLVGTIMDFAFTAGAHYLETSGDEVDVVALDPRDAIGASQGRVYFRFAEGNWA